MGDVSLEGLEGNWLTFLEISRIEIDHGQGVERVEQGRVRIWLAPWKLLTEGAAAVVERVDVEVAHVVVNVDGFASSEEEEASEEPFDLQQLMDLLPEGADVRCGELTLARAGRKVLGPATVHLKPKRGEASRVFRIDGPQVAARGRLDAGGALSWHASVSSIAEWVAVMVGEPRLRGGRLWAEGTLQLEPVLSAKLRAELRDTETGGRVVPWVDAAVKLDDTRLTDGYLEARGEGLHLAAHGFRCDLSDSLDAVLASMLGFASVSVEDVTPFREFLPPAIADLEPTVTADVRLDGSQLHVAGMRLQTRAGDALTAWGNIDLASLELMRIAERSQFEVAIDQLDLGAWTRALSIEPVDGVLHGGVSWRAAGTPDGLGVALSGEVSARELPPATVTLKAFSDAGGTRVEQLDVAASGVVLGVTASAPTLTLQHVLENTDSLTDLATAERVAARLDVTELDLGIWSRALAIEPIDGVVRGHATWQAQDAPGLVVDLRGDVRARDFPAAVVAVVASSDDAGTHVRSLDVIADGGELHATASAPDLPWRQLLEAPDLVRLSSVTANASISVPDASVFPLERWGAQQFAEVSGLSAAVEVTPSRVSIEELCAVVHGTPLYVAGVVTRTDEQVTVESLTLTQIPAGFVQLSGHVGTVDPAELLDAVLTRCEAKATVRNFDLGPWLALAQIPDVGGSVEGDLSWSADGSPKSWAG